MAYYNPLCNFAYGYIRDWEKVEDIVQEVFISVWNHREHLDTEQNIKGYLFKSTKNKALEELRRLKSTVKNLSNLEIVINAPDFDLEEQQECEDWVKIDQIYSSLRHLPPKCREVFELSKINGLTYTQIADKLKISPKTVENHIAKAYVILRNELVLHKK
jgi:RNA polymerase sigma-70 factor (ECF subfamily)